MSGIIEVIMSYSLKGYSIHFSNPGIVNPLGLRIDMSYYDAFYGKISASCTIENHLLNDNTIAPESVVLMAFDNLEQTIKKSLE